jgi:hypothetical protein
LISKKSLQEVFPKAITINQFIIEELINQNYLKVKQKKEFKAKIINN